VLIELTVYRWRFSASGYRNLFVGFFVATVGLPTAGLLVYTIISPGWLLDSYHAVTAFSLYERFLTETRVLWSYMQWIVLPSNTELALFHGDLSLSTGITEPLTTLAAIAAHLVLLALLVLLWFKKKESAFIFGVGFFYLSHSIE